MYGFNIFSYIIIGIWVVCLFMFLLLLLKEKYDWCIFINILLLSIAFVEPSFSDVLFIFLILFAFNNYSLDIKKIKNKSYIIILFYLFIIINTIPCLYISDYAQSVKFLAVTVYLICYSIFIGFYSFDKRVLIIARAYIIGSTISAILGIMGYAGIFQSVLMYDAFRAKALFKDPNVFGPFLIPTIIFMLEDIRTRRIFKGTKVIHVGIIILNVTGIILSFSRGALISLVFSTCCYLVLNHKNIKLKQLIAWIIITLLLGLFIWNIAFSDIMKLTFAERYKFQTYDKERFAAQKSGLDILNGRLFGYGPGQYGAIVEDKMTIKYDSHSLYVRILLENGIIGFLVFVSIIICIFWELLKCLRKNSLLNISCSVYISILFGVICNSFVIDTLHWRHFWLVIGLSLAVILEEDKNR